ncbi:sugar phosphate isomerase/epimerase family protein [Promicromonospora iranensis]|uniref:sugar phosphate isomerase/epimerase family protein n=1 Tax=Promicromonospora iranensis TaxID=1105144 RepID=UPI0023A9CC13|nr:sugar phosphate isomerase/epimerase [Promicromonospora iranensis]
MRNSLPRSRHRRQLHATALAAAMALGTLAAAPAATAASPDQGTAGCGSGRGIPDSQISIQLFTHVSELGFEQPTTEQLDRVFGEVAKAGFRNVELYNQPYDMPVEDLEALLDEHGLHAASSHGSTDWDTWPETVAYAAELGQRYIGAGGIPGSTATYEDTLETAAYLDQLGEYAHHHGVKKVLLHNHSDVFEKTFTHPETGETVTAWEVMVENTDPRYVTFELDLGWAADAGMDVAGLVEEHSDRMELLHVKDAVNIGAPEGLTQVGLGEGEMDFAPIFRAAKGDVKYYTYEWDFAPSFESSAKSYRFLDCFTF